MSECATCDLMDDGLPCEYHRGYADGAAVVGQERDHCAAANERAERWKARAEKNGYMALAAEKRADAAETAVARVRKVHGEYFDLDREPFDDASPEPEDVWRYDRDLRAALTGATDD